MLYFIFTFHGEVKAPKVLLHLRSQGMTTKHKLLYWSQAGVEGVPRLSDVFWASQEEMRQGPMSLIFWEQFCQVPGPQICLQLEESCSLPSSEEGHKGRDEAKG